MDACTRPVAPRPITLGCTLVQACPHHRTLWFHAARTSPAPPPQNPSTTFPFLGVPSGALETHVNLPTSQGRGIPSKWTPSILCHLQEVVPFSACHPVMCSVVGALTCGCRPSSPAHTHTHTHARTNRPSLPALAHARVHAGPHAHPGTGTSLALTTTIMCPCCWIFCTSGGGVGVSG
jgi:hypothetical protein